MLKLSYGFEYADLYQREGLVRLDARFLDFVAESDPAVHSALVAGRAAPTELAAKAESELLIALAPQLEDFVAQLFGIEAEARALAQQHHELAPIFSVKRLFVQRQALAKFKPEDVVHFDADTAAQTLLGEPFSELAFARRVTAWQEDEEANADQLELAARYAVWATGTKTRRQCAATTAVYSLDHRRQRPVGLCLR